MSMTRALLSCGHRGGGGVTDFAAIVTGGLALDVSIDGTRNFGVSA
jgi:hypothetical protein